MSDEDCTHQALSALERIDVEALDQNTREVHDDAVAVDTPEEWADDADEWDEKIEVPYEQAEIPRSKGTLTVKTIDDRENNHRNPNPATVQICTKREQDISRSS
ncbi:hypothetical protein [Haloarcula marismortui]|mgnify:CR=1 FL=1|uniref:Uncharacterized protein n=1 Tax=Haloarcula marismortui ATCC 33800 TaxID=662476 RepID=M0JQL8_9EURY|nr:hypothetical protein [Haloarcula sinaiiensis]EMA11291.1 hypothetical protein C436_16105 [Haloarcula sinaiiensis ATCC 33800]